MNKKFVLLGRSPSLNQLLGMHWAVRLKSERKWFHAIIATAGFKKPPETRFIILTLTSYRVKLLDVDNLIGGMKKLLDAIVRAGYMKDDSPEHCTVNYHQELCKKGQERVHVQIQDD